MTGSIFAPITGRGGAVTVLRLSGPGAISIAASLAGALPPPRRSSLCVLRHEGRVLDHALITLFAAPNSFTGEDCVEFSLHGGRAVLAVVSAALTALGARYAEPGEFSRRAFLHGKLGLLQAEALADLIAAETEAQRRLALDGGDALQAASLAWREALRQILAQQEALIDFPDEDLPPQVQAAMLARIAALRGEMAAALAAAPAAERLRAGLDFVILGAPNAGKSTLLNALAGEDIAITSNIPGTTRDVLSVRLDLSGVAVNVYDTAGLREAQDEIETEGIRRARARAATADFVISLASPPDFLFPEFSNKAAVLEVVTKSDLGLTGPSSRLAVCAVTGDGMAALKSKLTEIAIKLTDVKGAAALSRPRQVACLRDTIAALDQALAITAPELRGEELRAAAHALARLSGHIGVEEILDAVFSGFCIGK